MARGIATYPCFGGTKPLFMVSVGIWFCIFEICAPTRLDRFLPLRFAADPFLVKAPWLCGSCIP